MRSTPLQPFGTDLDDLSLERPSPELAAELRVLLAEHGVLVMRGQYLDDEGLVDFLRSFGELAFTEGEQQVAGFPDLNVVSNVGRVAPPRSSFHVDTSYVRSPPAYTALRAVKIPRSGGQTMFSDQRRAYETLDGELRQALAGRTILHRVTGLELDRVAETEAEHPVFRPHPLTDRISLYLSSFERCVAVSGMSRDESTSTIAALLAHSTQERNLLKHSWLPGDIVMWDNACVLHRADHSDVLGDRVMHRGMVAGYGADGEVHRT